jgi:TIR domain
VPSWPLLSKIVLRLGGDEDEFRDLWAASRHAGTPTEGLPAPAESSKSDVSIFVSYARVDEEATYSRVTKFASSIKRLHESMTGERARLYMGADSSAAGDIWVDLIRLGMSSSAILLVVISPAYLRSAARREEYRELTSFVCASSDSRLIVPLLFSERERIEKYFGDHAIWAEMQELRPVPVEQVRCEEPGSYEWVRKTQEVVNRIESVLADVAMPTSSKVAEAVKSAERDAVNTTAFFEVLADAQDAAPKTTAHIEALSTLLVRLGNEASKATAGMNRATTTKRKLAISRQTCRRLPPSLRLSPNRSTACVSESTSGTAPSR